MSTRIFLGNPPECIKRWIESHQPTPPAPVGRAATRIWYEGCPAPGYEDFDITGTLDRQWMIDNWFYENWDWSKTITQVEIGNTVTSIDSSVFADCCGLTSVTITSSVTCIGDEAFSGCSGLTEINAPGFTCAYVQANAPLDPDTWEGWGVGNGYDNPCTIHCSDGDVTING